MRMGFSFVDWAVFVATLKFEASVALPWVDSCVVWLRVEDFGWVYDAVAAQSVRCFDAIDRDDERGEPGRTLGDPGPLEAANCLAISFVSCLSGKRTGKDLTMIVNSRRLRGRFRAESRLHPHVCFDIWVVPALQK
ncbi:hypothetical protein E4U09_005398 [Claviceps aff. purpurea]|uniref:Secreted protein n=1 Tax=Claviceps aff. purpurea TaxID=1967640 RepID=A0A9P7QC47_9HYPO|nr:hypothetical protein E4U09_005398 [Claviceps aff. purpurea]